jgi:hypothetical protein
LNFCALRRRRFFQCHHQFRPVCSSLRQSLFRGVAPPFIGVVRKGFPNENNQQNKNAQRAKM